MSAGAWAGLAVAAWELFWFWLGWRLARRDDVNFHKRLLNSSRQPWE